MIDSLATRWLSRNAATLPLALVLLLSLGCLRNVDVDRLKCTMADGTCPKDYVCVMHDGGEYGTCVARGADAGPRAETDAEVDSQDPARVLDGASTDGHASNDVPTSSVADDAADNPIDAPEQGSPDVLSLADSGNEADKLPNGSTCTLDTECTSDHCVDGVCCDGLCDGQCESCKESGSPGKCVAVKGAPVVPRTACAGTGGCKGLCDGANGKVCALADGTTVCSPPKCAAGTATPASVCNGKGACTQPTSGSCPSGLCASDNSGKCVGSCTALSCGDGLFCNTAGVCTAKKAPGASCTGKDECTTGFCSDGVCCESACTGQCQVCDSKGACIRVTGNPRSGHTPCTAADVTCGGTCDGTSDACVYKASETVCTAATCSNTTTAVSASVCDGKGACTAAQSTNCASSGSYCSVNKCAAKQPNGGACQENVECTSGNCSNGTCCGAGQAGCSGTCVDLQTSANNCGICGRACGTGLSCCAGSCANLTLSNTNCGSCGNSCGAQTCMTGVCCASGSTNCGGSCCDSNHTCSGSTCTCKVYAPSCGGCEAWGFESNTTEGWIRTPTSVRSAVDKNGIQSMNIVTGSYAHSGDHALAMRITTDGTSSNGAYFVVPLCPSGSTVTVPTGITLTAWMRFVSDPARALASWNMFQAELYGPSSSIGRADDTIGGSIPENTWFKFTVQFNTTPSPASHVGFFWLSSNDWNGMVYLDDVQLKM